MELNPFASTKVLPEPRKVPLRRPPLWLLASVWLAASLMPFSVILFYYFASSVEPERFEITNRWIFLLLILSPIAIAILLMSIAIAVAPLRRRVKVALSLLSIAVALGSAIAAVFASMIFTGLPVD
jgi:hypothetical protein